MIDPCRLYTTADIAALLNCSPVTLWKVMQFRRTGRLSKGHSARATRAYPPMRRLPNGRYVTSGRELIDWMETV